MNRSLLARPHLISEEAVVKTHQPRKGNIVSLRVVFEPNRLERISLQAAYERLVPIVRRATFPTAKAECQDQATRGPRRASR
jgi:hypothetical protein